MYKLASQLRIGDRIALRDRRGQAVYVVRNLSRSHFDHHVTAWLVDDHCRTSPHTFVRSERVTLVTEEAAP